MSDGVGLFVSVLAVGVWVGTAVVSSCTADKICYPNRSVTLVAHGDYVGAVCASPAGPVLKKRGE